MAKKIDDTLATILKTYGETSSAVWDCHGTWVAYHAAIERIAAKANITFDQPTIIESNGATGNVSICVTGRLGDKAEWSFGEASPKNNKNAYPYAMAEKRAKDRVVLKLIGLHGMVYSEEESDDFKVNRLADSNIAPKADEPTESEKRIADQLVKSLATVTDMASWKRNPANVEMFKDIPPALREQVQKVATERLRAISQPITAAG